MGGDARGLQRRLPVGEKFPGHTDISKPAYVKNHIKSLKEVALRRVSQLEAVSGIDPTDPLVRVHQEQLLKVYVKLQYLEERDILLLEMKDQATKLPTGQQREVPLTHKQIRVLAALRLQEGAPHPEWGIRLLKLRQQMGYTDGQAATTDPLVHAAPEPTGTRCRSRSMSETRSEKSDAVKSQ